ncbi:trna (5-methylaminomethyl-2-thiouridylate)-methyltransferase [Moniliophthora roreri MCA 2997]|uniref:tRNA-5-taurinomethyluridine 2-sulfurtransferase n=2 Tax=Moniliophthora roreri TaxID=221103 RepID=V2XX96_MONRO|nr:trna (5-methylaminomethyl-2-thiouridylate)-methyltransferase [Moniliophthora roreri MCA 2997]
MSGGVDSSVVARLLTERDHDLSAVFMRNWDLRDESGTDEGCQWERDWNDVQRLCKALDIPCKMVDLSKEYWTRIFEPSLEIWQSGQTPNPDVLCNREIKFGALLDQLSLDEGTWLATGHYARKVWQEGSNPRPKLLSAKDRIKDQAFYLASINETGLSRALFPLGNLLKSQVKEMARKWNLDAVERKESTGLCFIGERSGRFSQFLTSYITPKPGPIYDLLTHKQVGEHRGLWSFTTGENARISGMSQRMFVAHRDTKLNAIFVVPGGDNKLLHCDTVVLHDWSWIWRDTLPPGLSTTEGFEGFAKIRHRMSAVPCTVKLIPVSAIPSVFTREDGQGQEQALTVTFSDPYIQSGVSPGQIAAIWDSDGEWCLGCGSIGAAYSMDLVTALDDFSKSL